MRAIGSLCLGLGLLKSPFYPKKPNLGDWCYQIPFPDAQQDPQKWNPLIAPQFPRVVLGSFVGVPFFGSFKGSGQVTDEDGKVGRTIVFANTKAGLVAVVIAADQA